MGWHYPVPQMRKMEVQNVPTDVAEPEATSGS